MKPAESSKLRDNVTGTCTTATITTNAYVTLDLYEYVHVVSVTMAATVSGLFTIAYYLSILLPISRYENI